MSLPAENQIPLSISVNQREYQLAVTANTRLLDLLRNELGLTGTKEGCAVGECGACTVVMDGDTVCSCMVLAAQCHGSEVITIEGLKQDPLAQQLQQAFIELGGVQCGFCTPGVLMSTWALLKKHPKPDQDTIMDCLEGNLCRCTGYQPILNAITSVINHINQPSP
ncbi:(2Fe-2S)-binding protein [Photobacterium sanctipauli]|uniref:(2Fe-2S)-binding protein n=1 Tax=Photobacterium sanctipauli TaxID=1342794 RepID=A0A2T3NNL9_9GAMM|nr:(2Fe-2S)-binding protein [Photobacterium sanctipauli]PSW17567.1 (2Fe-2S)-binding protein [Photobacterium sanctipauli]